MCRPLAYLLVAATVMVVSGSMPYVACIFEPWSIPAKGCLAGSLHPQSLQPKKRSGSPHSNCSHGGGSTPIPIGHSSVAARRLRAAAAAITRVTPTLLNLTHRRREPHRVPRQVARRTLQPGKPGKRRRRQLRQQEEAQPFRRLEGTIGPCHVPWRAPEAPTECLGPWLHGEH
jgi:hypothetical protein